MDESALSPHTSKTVGYTWTAAASTILCPKVEAESKYTRSQATRGPLGTFVLTAVQPSIQHVFVLMLENRSFDNVSANRAVQVLLIRQQRIRIMRMALSTMLQAPPPWQW